jgi:hyaluronoglucosaminidase
LTVALSAPRELAGLTVLQQSSAVGSADVEVQVDGTWQNVGSVAAEYAEVPVNDLNAQAFRLVWKSGTPAVAELVPLWADTPLATVRVDEGRADVVRGETSSFAVDISAERGADVSGTLSVAAPAGWTADPASTAVAVKRGFTQSVTVRLTPPADAALADVDIPVTFTSGTTVFEGVLRLAVRPRTTSTNVALHGPVVASSIEPGTSFTADLAVDGDAATRWASGYDDAAWFQVDLGTATRLGKVVLRWEAAYGRAYQIQVSDDATTWTTAAEVTDGDGGTDTVWLDASARYVRLQGVDRATQYGYSLYELEVFGTTGG